MSRRIAVDAMGGDRAPGEIIKGVVKAAGYLPDIYLILVGKSDIIIPELNTHSIDNERVEVVEASQVIEMGETPSRALRKKKDSSIYIGSNLLRRGKAEAFISAGNTGAVMASGLFNVGRISGIHRPCIATIFPSRKGETLVLDAGANVDSDPENLLQFALMGQIYAANVLKIQQPGIGLLSIGEEKEKGNRLTKETHEILAADDRIKNFVGNIEGRDIFSGSCDVVVCDGFVGNIVLKTTEGVASFMFSMLREVLTENIIAKTGALLTKPYLQKLKDRVDYRQYGGAPLLGLKGNIIISHGSSDKTAIFNAIKAAVKTIDKDIVALIRSEIKEDGEGK